MKLYLDYLHHSLGLFRAPCIVRHAPLKQDNELRLAWAVSSFDSPDPA